MLLRIFMSFLINSRIERNTTLLPRTKSAEDFSQGVQSWNPLEREEDYTPLASLSARNKGRLVFSIFAIVS